MGTLGAVAEDAHRRTAAMNDECALRAFGRHFIGVDNVLDASQSFNFDHRLTASNDVSGVSSASSVAIVQPMEDRTSSIAAVSCRQRSACSMSLSCRRRATRAAIVTSPSRPSRSSPLSS
jgi:hypothetical protein